MDSSVNQDGKVTIRLHAEGAGIVRLRIPGYADNWKIIVNHTELEPVAQAGYCVVKFDRGDTIIELDLTVTAHWLGANQRVRSDIGKAALQRGPFIYCLEQADNGSLLGEIYIDQKTKVQEAAPEQTFVGDIPTLYYQGIRLNNRAIDRDSLYGDICMEKTVVSLRAVPYCFWNNRGEGEMLVWHKLMV